ncbi:hypothetical protein SEPCBS57363_004408 [Sporothrix epigloea]|uniref:C3H1-type domain-containing protein n=1 Tax=Sporothrix epigloea TaxID=1892477 RepID=A0ABP0DTP2_9PEZI
MSSENQELLARISQLAGHINRHKNQQAGISSISSSTYNSSAPPFYGRGAYSARGRGGGYRVQKPAAHRHRALVLNASGTLGRPDVADSGDSPAASSDNSSSAWVARTDRHRQLINADVYEKDAQLRARAIEHTRVQNLQKRDARERAKLQSHLTYLARGSRPTGNNSAAVANTVYSTHQIVIDGISFVVAKNGSKLVKVSGASPETSQESILILSQSPIIHSNRFGKHYPAYLQSHTGDTHAASSTPKTAIVGGVKFYRSKNGNMYRHGVVRAQQRLGGRMIKKTNEPCRAFSTTGTFELPNLPFFTIILDEDDKLSHHGISCLANLVSSGAPVCRPFGLHGYCDRGADCTERHVFECPDFSNTGVCKIKGCKLPHRERASFMRRANHNTTANISANNSGSDVSSDDESVNSDDIDSDEVDEFVGPDGDDTGFDFVAQKDYVEI